MNEGLSGPSPPAILTLSQINEKAKQDSGPAAIKRLDPSVVNKIAAGEVLACPANAVKEMLENSLDAGATLIRIIIKEGGIKLIQIQDNGKGIRKEDLWLACERHATSKLEKFDDLKHISSFGFRGEALASISYVAHITIQSMTLGSKCAFKASYQDGKMIGEPKPVAGTPGTQILVEDLFYNMAPRRKGLQLPKDEAAKVFDVVSRYAIHCDGVGFCLKRQGEQTNALITQPQLNKQEKIRLVFGDAIARELIEARFPDPDPDVIKELSGWVTHPNFNTKRPIFILFINNRLVESTFIRKTVEHVYANFLPKGTHPFVYFSLLVPPERIDVNIHPTKHQVVLLDQEIILDMVQTCLSRALLAHDSSRTFSAQPIGISSNSSSQIAMLNSLERSKRGISKRKSEENSSQSQKIRIDPKIQTLHPFFSPAPVLAVPKRNLSILESSPPKLSSISELIQRLESSTNKNLQSVFRECTLVGVVNSCFSTIQHRTKLYLVNTISLSKHVFYQNALIQFPNYSKIRFKEPLSLSALLLLALESPESNWNDTFGPKEKVVNDLIEQVLSPNAEMLLDYFSIGLENSKLICLPQIFENYLPNLGLLPSFLLSLCTKVNWQSEQDCFDCILRALSEFFAFHPSAPLDEDLQLRMELFFSKGLSSICPPKDMATDGTIVQIASLEKLYQQFERC